MKCTLCDNPARAKGLCKKHHTRLLRHGDPNHCEKVQQEKCKICGAPHKAKGFCDVHYYRFRVNGDPEKVLRQNGKEWIQDGYIYKRINGKKTEAHRAVMENHVGRALLRNEHVHHLNGNRQDNRIENLVITNSRDHHKKYHINSYDSKTGRFIGQKLVNPSSE